MTPKRIWLASIAFAAIVATLVVVIAVRSGSSPTVPRRAISGQTFLSRSAALFADPLKARIEVLTDSDRIDPARVGFRPRFEPYTRVGIPQLEREDKGRLTRLVYTANLICSTFACLPSFANFTSARIQFPTAKVFYWRKDDPDRRRTLEVPWQGFTLGPRTSAPDIANADPFVQPAWRATTEPAAASYRMSPRLLQSLLFTGSGLLFVAALGAFAFFVRAVRARLRVPRATPLEYAVALVEEAADTDDQQAKRKALELLSRELTHSGEGELALAARELAWAEPAPVPAATQPLTLDVRRLIAERSNGRVR